MLIIFGADTCTVLSYTSLPTGAMDGAAVDSSHLLSQLEDILDSHPRIDELGFIHPSQFAALNEEANGSPISKPSDSCNSDTFICTENKLGISTLVLIPLYGTAKDAFMDSFRRYKMSLDTHGQTNDVSTLNFSKSDLDIVENEVMRHSRALVLLSCDFGTAWNSRKIVILSKQQFPMFMDELLLSTLVLSCAPKSECAWSHRRWVIKMIADKCANLQEIVERESVLVKTIAENSKMNYRAWNHRCWLVSYMSHAQVILELQNSRDWTGLHVADNSCLHYRTRLLLQMVENLKDNRSPDSFSAAEFHQMWKEELHWDELLIRRYIGREALWLHRRFLSLFWIKHLTSDDQNIDCHSLCKSSENDDIFMFINAELKLFDHCTIIPDNVFEDYEAQAIHSATYIMWLAKKMPTPFGIQLRNSSQYGALETLLKKTGKSFLLDSLTENCVSIQSLN